MAAVRDGLGFDRRIALGLFVVTFVTYASFFNGGGWNANVNLDLARAVVEDRTLFIDRFAANSGDVSSSGGHVYSNKPPGLSFLAAIPYAAVHLAGVEDPIVVLWLLTVLVCATTGALIPVLLYRYGRRSAIAPLPAVIVALAIGFGTYVFSYSTVFFAHVPCAAFLLLALYWLERRPMLAGIAAGMAGTIFLLAIPAAAVLAVLAATRSMRKAARFVAGGAPFGILLALYQHAAFGSPWHTPVESSTAFTSEGLIFGVFGRPRLMVVGELLFGIKRGLFPLSPVLLLAFVGVVVMIRRRAQLRELAAIAVMIAIFVLANASFNNWDAGSSIGPRYILPIVPLLGVPMLFAGDILRFSWSVFGAISLAVNFLVAAVDPMPGGMILNPVREYILPVFLTGQAPFDYPTDGSHVAVNPQTPEERCAFCNYPSGHPRTLWASFNLGELILPRGSAVSVLPIALWMLGGGIALLRTAARAGPARG